MHTFVKLTKHMKLIPEYLRLAIKMTSEYKITFYFFIFNQILQVSIWIFFWKVMIDAVGAFGEWDFPLMLLLTGFTTINMALTFVFISVWRVPRFILEGKLNMYLIRPVHPFIHIIGSQLNLASLPRIIFGIGIIVYALINYSIPYTPLILFFAFLINLLSVIIAYIPFAIICVSAFWLGKADFIRDLFVELFTFKNYPLTEFPASLSYFFTYIFPFIFAGTIPAFIISRNSLQTSLYWLGICVGIIIIQLVLFNYIWKKGLIRYESYGG